MICDNCILTNVCGFECENFIDSIEKIELMRLEKGKCPFCNHIISNGFCSCGIFVSRLILDLPYHRECGIERRYHFGIRFNNREVEIYLLYIVKPCKKFEKNNAKKCFDCLGFEFDIYCRFLNYKNIISAVF